MTTIDQSRINLEQLKACCQTDTARATELECGLFTAAALAAESAVTPADWMRAKELAAIALDAQQVSFRRCYEL